METLETCNPEIGMGEKSMRRWHWRMGRRQTGLVIRVTLADQTSDHATDEKPFLHISFASLHC